MTLHLSDRALQNLQKLSTDLLTPLEHDTASVWLDKVSRGVSELFEADGVVAIVPGGDGSPIFGFHGAGPDLAAALHTAVSGIERNALQFRYPLLDRLMRRLTTAGVKVWTPELAERITRVRRTDMAFYHEVVVPHGIEHQADMAVPLPDGLALIGFFHRSAESDPHRDNRVPILELLFPAFQGGVWTHARLGRDRLALERQLDRTSDAVFAFDASGTELFRNRRARELVAGPAGSAVIRAARRLAERVFSLRSPQRKAAPEEPPGVPGGYVSLDGTEIHLTAGLLPAGMIDRRAVVVVQARPRIPQLPSIREIERRFELTRRQAQIARLIAGDHTSAEMAERLGISVHTVRRHAEKVLSALGVRSRKGVGLRLLECGGVTEEFRPE